MEQIASDLAKRLIPKRKALMAWSSGRDDEFGGRFFCFHGLSQEEHDALKGMAESFHRPRS